MCARALFVVIEVQVKTRIHHHDTVPIGRRGKVVARARAGRGAQLHGVPPSLPEGVLYPYNWTTEPQKQLAVRRKETRASTI